MMNSKIYLFPSFMRAGSPCIVFVEKTESSYWIGIAFGQHKSNKKGVGVPYVEAYENVSRQAISKDLYDAFVIQSKLNHKILRPFKKNVAFSG